MTLLDAGVWLAAGWSRHAHHARARLWFDAAEGPFAFCRVTQMAFLRLMTNPVVTGVDALSRRDAWNALERVMADPRVAFLPEPEGLELLWIEFSKRDDKSHLLWTDDYLAAFAAASDAEAVTLDRAWIARYPSVRVTCLT